MTNHIRKVAKVVHKRKTPPFYQREEAESEDHNVKLAKCHLCDVRLPVRDPAAKDEHMEIFHRSYESSTMDDFSLECP